VVDIRNIGLIGAVELQPIEGKPTARAQQLVSRCFDNGVIVRTTGDTAAFSPPLIIEKQHIDQIIDTVRAALRAI
jgi:beta-alanine--pyruvate transaminase